MPGEEVVRVRDPDHGHMRPQSGHLALDQIAGAELVALALHDQNGLLGVAKEGVVVAIVEVERQTESE